MAETIRGDTLERGGQFARGGPSQRVDSVGEGVESRDHGASDWSQGRTAAVGTARPTDDERPGGSGVHCLDPVPGGAVGDSDLGGRETDRSRRVHGPQQGGTSGTDIGAVRPAHPGLHPHLDDVASAPPGSGSGLEQVLPHRADSTSPASPVSEVYHRRPDPVPSRSERGRRSTRFWAHVTAFGAAWGAFEITLGSLLHSLRVPFAGVVLSSLGAAVLVAQRQFLPDRGASLATAAVAALCKSLSPDGLVLGPMSAILMEGLLVEAALLAAPRSVVPAALAGSLCALWSAFQKLISRVVFFGGGVVDLYLGALRAAGKSLGVSSRTGWTLLAVFCLVVALVGATGGILGRALGRQAARRLAAAEAPDVR